MCGVIEVPGHRHVWSLICQVIGMLGHWCVVTGMCGVIDVWPQACVVIDVPCYRHVWSLMCLVIGMRGHRHIYIYVVIDVCSQVCVWSLVCAYRHVYGHLCSWSQACVWSLMFLVTCMVISVLGHRHVWGHWCSWLQAHLVVTVSGHRHVWLLLCLVTGVNLIMRRYTCLKTSAITECHMWIREWTRKVFYVLYINFHSFIHSCQTVRSCIQCWSFSERTDWKQAAAEENRGHRETDASNAE